VISPCPVGRLSVGGNGRSSSVNDDARLRLLIFYGGQFGWLFINEKSMNGK
jgi:hypothetical protein